MVYTLIVWMVWVGGGAPADAAAFLRRFLGLDGRK